MSRHAADIQPRGHYNTGKIVPLNRGYTSTDKIKNMNYSFLGLEVPREKSTIYLLHEQWVLTIPCNS